MWIFNQPSSAARTALVYITLGALIVIWTGVWFLYLSNHPDERQSSFYWCGGLMLTGVTLMAIGFGLGHIGRSARHADLPPQETPDAITKTPPSAVPVLPPSTPTPPALSNSVRPRRPSEAPGM